MKSQIIQGYTYHRRLVPRWHAFAYPMLWLRLDIDELPLLNRELRGFGHNRRALVSICDADYAGPGAGPLRDKVIRLLSREGITGTVHRIDLITLPKVLGYVFNPVSFFICYDCDGQLVALIAEVNNTFGEKHHYIQKPLNQPGQAWRFQFPKRFYVSPFSRVQGDYELRLTEDPDRKLTIQINLRQDDQLVLAADMVGQGTPLMANSLARVAIRLPIIVGGVMARIHRQAILLYVRKRTSVYPKPDPSSSATIPARVPGMWHRLRTTLIRWAAGGTRQAAPSFPTLRERT